MFRETQEAPQTMQPRQEVKENKRRFQIVKLEERIAPRPGDHGHGCEHNSNACHGR